MNLKRVTAFALAAVMAAGVFVGSLGMARAAKDDYSIKTAVEERLDAREKALAALTDDERDAIYDEFSDVFKSLDFTGLNFQERAAVMDAAMFNAYLTERGFSKKDIKELESARAKAVAAIPAAEEKQTGDVNFKDWLYSEAFDDAVLAQDLTDDQVAALLSEDNRIVWNIGLALGYLRQLGVKSDDAEKVYNAILDEYRKLVKTEIVDPSGYNTESYVFDAVVALIEAGKMDDFVKNRDKKTGELSGKQLVELAEIMDAVQPGDDYEVFQASQARSAA